VTVRDYTKLVIAFMVVIAAVTLLYFGKIEGEAGVGLLAMAMGYVFGNAHALIERK